MADIKLVGAVAIKLRPDARGFRTDADKKIKAQLAGYNADVDVTAEVRLDDKAAKADAKKLEKDLEGASITWKVKLDHDSVKAATARFKSMLEPTQTIKFNLDDEGSIEAARAELAEMARDARVKITYYQDEKGYQSVLDRIAALRREKLEKTITPSMDEAEWDAIEREMHQKLAEFVTPPIKQTVHIEVEENRASLAAAIAKIDAELGKIDAVKFDVELNREALLAKRAELQEDLDRAPLVVRYSPDRAGYEEVLKKIEDLRRKRIEIDIDLNLSDAELAAKAAEIQAKLDGLTRSISLSYTNDRDSLKKAIADIKAQQDKVRAIKFDVELDPAKLAAKRAELEAILAGTPVQVRINYNDMGSIKAARAQLQEALNEVNSATILVSVNRPHLEAELARLDARIRAEEARTQVKLRVGLDPATVFKTIAALKTIAKDQVVHVYMRLSKSGVLLAAAKLTGLRAAARWTEGFAKALGRLDRNLPIVAALVLGISTLTSGILSLTANVLSLGNGLGEVFRMFGVLTPAVLLGLGAVMTVFTGVFKDFGAAVNGDDKAIKKLSASGQAAAAQIRTVFQAIRETISKNFWDRASDGMLRFSQVSLPAVGAGLGALSTSLGGIFTAVLDSMNTFTNQGGVKVFFDNMVRGFDIAQTGMASFMSGFLTLSVVGSTVFPKIGRSFEAWAGRFDDWVQRLAADGTLNRWIDRGVQGMKDLFNAAGSLTKAWGNIGQAAQAAGALTLHSFARMMADFDRVTAANRFQTNMANIFRGAREASIAFHDSLGALGPAMDVFSLTIKNSLAGAGAALGSFMALLGDLMSSPLLDSGMTAFLSGIKSMFESLRPAAGAIASIMQTFGQILGAVATDSGPLFRNLFQQLSTVLTTAWHALEPFLPGLIQLGTTIINILGPALASLTGAAIPAFASGVQKIGDGLVPLVKGLADFARGAITLTSAVPLPMIAAFVTNLLVLGGAMKVAAVVVPLAGAALTAFGAAAAVTAARVQLMVPVIGIALAAMTGLVAGGVVALATSMRSSTPYANEYADAINEDARAVGYFSDAVGDATKKLAVKKLVDSGALDAARKLGIETQEVTDAVFKGGTAWDNIKRKIDLVNKVYGENKNEARYAAAGNAEFGSSFAGADGPTPAMQGAKEAADLLNGSIMENRGSFAAATKTTRDYAEANKAAGIVINNETEALEKLETQTGKTRQTLGAAAAASTTLNDAFASTTAKVDAMRKTFEILLPPNSKQDVAETLGAYVRGFNDIRDSVKPLAQDIRNLGDEAYGENGFFNVAGGNKAVMQANQALVDHVNNIWAGAKAAYDAAILQGKTAQQAFSEAQTFISDRKGDYDQLATDSGVAADRVQGQWEAVFGHEWVLKVSLSGATEAAARAQEMVTALKGTFDGQKFTAQLDADPTLALLAIENPTAAAEYFVNTEWNAKLGALPEEAQKVLRQQIGVTDEEWNKGDFKAILRVAQEVPGLSDALLKIFNGVSAPYYAKIFAELDGASELAVRIALNNLTMTRRMAIQVAYSEVGKVPVARGGDRVWMADGGIMRNAVQAFANGGFSRPTHRFAAGGFEKHVAQIQKAGGPVRVWAEPETYAEAYIPYAQSKRPRSVAILSQVAKDFGYSLSRASEFSNGGIAAGAAASPTRTSSTSVTVGTINTVDPEMAVRKLRALQQDALAVAGII